MKRPLAFDFPNMHHKRQLTNSARQAFENTSTSVAAAQMRNSLTNLAETVQDPEQKAMFETEMDNFFALFRRYLNDKAKGNSVYVLNGPEPLSNDNTRLLTAHQ